MKTKHGGSEPSGLVVPAGLEHLKPEVPNGMVLVPQEVVDAREEAKKRTERALQLERRRIALEIVPTLLPFKGCKPGLPMTDAEANSALVAEALEITDELMKQTGGGI